MASPSLWAPALNIPHTNAHIPPTQWTDWDACQPFLCERERETEREPERAQLIIQVSNTGVGISEIKSYLHCWVVLSPDQKLEKSLSSKRSDPSSICKVPPLFTASLRIGDSCIRLKEIILFWSAGTDLVSRWSGPQLMAFWLQLDKNQSRVGTPAVGTQRCRCISRKMFKILVEEATKRYWPHWHCGQNLRPQYLRLKVWWMSQCVNRSRPLLFTLCK